MSTATVTRVWHTIEDRGEYLCDECGVAELNGTTAVMMGLLPPFTSVESAQDMFNQMEDVPSDYFIEETEDGLACVACGATVASNTTEETA